MTPTTNAHISHIAGKVYRCLKKSGKPMSILELSLKLKLWPWDVFMALGWLASENKIRFRRYLLALMAEVKK